MPLRQISVIAATVVVLLLSWWAPHARSQEMRAFWADAWHAGYRNAAQVDQLVADVRAANMNTIIVQVRRRGDVYFDSSLEPWASDSGGPAFDALAYLCQKAHSGTPRIEVHAWLVIGAVWGESGWPTPPNHILNAHPEFLSATSSGNLYDGEGYWIDLGHPACADYHINLCMEMVRNYDIDGVHLDRIRFPNNTWGYNAENLSRFKQRFARTADPQPADAEWLQWRRVQITNFVRRLYLSVISEKPLVKVSAACNTRAPGITTLEQWPSSAAYSSTLQDWRAWLEEGIVDIAIPMTYMDEDDHGDVWDRWTQFQKDYHYGRHAAAGQGAYINTVADTILQIRRLRQPSPSGNHVQGVSLYSYAVTNDNDPVVSRAAFIAALTAAPNAYDPSPEAVFAHPASVPAMPWKTSPSRGHLKGVVVDAASLLPLETASVVLAGGVSSGASCDANGFYGLVDLGPGSYQAVISAPGYLPLDAPVNIQAGMVTALNAQLQPTLLPPVITDVSVGSISAFSATVTWQTNDPATSEVEYGLSQGYLSSTIEDAGPTTGHTAVISGLSPGTTYYFRCLSRNFNGTGVSAGQVFTTSASFSSQIIVDNPDAVFSGSWTTASSAAGFYGGDYRYTGQRTSETADCVWRPLIPLSGPYDVEVYYPAGSNRSDHAPYEIHDSAGVTDIAVNQQTNGGQWVKIGSFRPFVSGSDGFVRLHNNTGQTTGVVIADAVRFTYRGAAPLTSIGTARLLSDGVGVNLLPKPVTAVGSDHFYIQEPDGSAAIRVDGAASFVPGDVVQVRGFLSTDRLERRIQVLDAGLIGSGTEVHPLLMSSRNLGGGGTPPHLPGIHPGTGLTNTGLLVTIFGRVSHVEGVTFWLDDSSGVSSGGHSGIQVLAPGIAPPALGSWLRTTGIVSPMGEAGAETAGIVGRSAQDVTPL